MARVIYELKYLCRQILGGNLVKYAICRSWISIADCTKISLKDIWRENLLAMVSKRKDGKFAKWDSRVRKESSGAISKNTN